MKVIEIYNDTDLSDIDFSSEDELLIKIYSIGGNAFQWVEFCQKAGDKGCKVAVENHDIKPTMNNGYNKRF